MRILASSIALSMTVAALTGCEESRDLDDVRVFDLASDSERVCAPPADAPAHHLTVVGDAPVTLTGALYEEAETSPRSRRGEAVREPGVEVALWRVRGENREAELAVTQTDAEGAFSLELDPTEIRSDAGIAFVIDGEVEQWLYPMRPEPVPGGNQILCAYWAHPDDGMLLVGQLDDMTVALVVEAMGDLEPPELVVREVGNDLSGDDVMGRPEGEPFVDGISHTLWEIEAEQGFLDGNQAELQFSATAWPEGDENDASAAVSGWMYVQ